MKIEKIKHAIERFKNTTQSLDPADERLKKLDIDFVRKFSRIIESHPDIHNHSKYIAEKSLLIAGGLDMSAEETEDIFYAGLLIQLGKITLPTKLLSKPFHTLSTVDKYRYLNHAVDGADLLQDLPQFKGASLLIRHQYEQYNGLGFPDGLKHINIPLGARILSVTRDYIEFLEGSMTGKSMYIDAARSQLLIRKESHYDPDVVEVFVNVIKGATVEDLREALARSRQLAIATERWTKGLLIPKRNKNISDLSRTVEITIQQLKLGMKVDSIYFGSEAYIRNCTVDQSIIDNVTALHKADGKRPIIKIFLDDK